MVLVCNVDACSGTSSVEETVLSSIILFVCLSCLCCRTDAETAWTVHGQIPGQGLHAGQPQVDVVEIHE